MRRFSLLTLAAWLASSMVVVRNAFAALAAILAVGLLSLVALVWAPGWVLSPLIVGTGCVTAVATGHWPVAVIVACAWLLGLADRTVLDTNPGKS